MRFPGRALAVGHDDPSLENLPEHQVFEGFDVSSPAKLRQDIKVFMLFHKKNMDSIIK